MPDAIRLRQGGLQAIPWDAQGVDSQGKKIPRHPSDVESQREKFGTAYNMAFHDLFAKSYEDYLGYVQPILPEATVDTKAFLEDYFNIDLTI